MPILFELIHWILQALMLIILFDVIMSYIPSIPHHNPIIVAIRKVSRSILKPIGKIIPPLRIGDAYADFSPIVAILILSVIDSIVRRLH